MAGRRRCAPQVQSSEKTPLLTCLLEGPAGSGKSAMAATTALESEFPFIKVVTPESFVGFSEQVGARWCCGVVGYTLRGVYKQVRGGVLRGPVCARHLSMIGCADAGRWGERGGPRACNTAWGG